MCISQKCQTIPLKESLRLAYPKGEFTCFHYEPYLHLFPLTYLSSFPPGTTLTCLQLALKFAGLAYIPAFTKIYQRTLDWFPGFVFTLSSIFTVLGMIPIRQDVDDTMLLALITIDLYRLWLIFIFQPNNLFLTPFTM